jgi:hypothetical protein
MVQTLKGAHPMFRHSHQHHSGRVPHTDPLRRLFGLRLLAEALPEPVGQALLRAWQQPARYDGNQAIQSLHRQRPNEAALPFFPPPLLGVIAQVELEVSRRMVEIPRTAIQRETRNALLRGQAAYLHCVYNALAGQIGEAAAQAELVRRLWGIR